MASSSHAFLSYSMQSTVFLVHSDDFLKNLHTQFRWEQIYFLREDSLEISSTQRMQEL